MVLKEPKASYNDAKARFNKYFSVKTSILLKRKEFFEARQHPRESISEFACRIRRLAKDCEFRDTATMQRDIFVIGVANDRLGEHLLTEDAAILTFDAAVAKAEAVERACQDRDKHVLLLVQVEDIAAVNVRQIKSIRLLAKAR